MFALILIVIGLLMLLWGYIAAFTPYLHFDADEGASAFSALVGFLLLWAGLILI